MNCKNYTEMRKLKSPSNCRLDLTTQLRFHNDFQVVSRYCSCWPLYTSEITVPRIWC